MNTTCFRAAAFLTLVLALFAGASACKPTYRKDTIKESVRALAQKEIGTSVEVVENGRTLGLRFRVPDLAGEISSGNDDLTKKLNSLLTVLIRVALSSDVSPQFIVLDIIDEERPLFHLTFTRQVDDLRRSMAEAISYTDSQDRMLQEFVVGGHRVAYDPYEMDLVRLVMMSADAAGQKTVPPFVVEDLTLEDFVARVAENKARRIVRERTLEKGDVALRDVTASYPEQREGAGKEFQILVDLVATTTPKLPGSVVKSLMPVVAAEAGHLFKSYKLDFSQILVVEKNTGQVFKAPVK